MNTTDITEILRAIASETKSSAGDHWSKNWCNDAAVEIERLRAEVKKLNDEIASLYEDAAGEDL